MNIELMSKTSRSSSNSGLFVNQKDYFGEMLRVFSKFPNIFSFLD